MGELTGQVIWIILIILVIILLASCLKIVPQAHAYVIERLGAYHTTWMAGAIKFKVPFIDRIAKVISLKVQVSISTRSRL